MSKKKRDIKRCPTCKVEYSKGGEYSPLLYSAYIRKASAESKQIHNEKIGYYCTNCKKFFKLGEIL